MSSYYSLYYKEILELAFWTKDVQDAFTEGFS